MGGIGGIWHSERQDIREGLTSLRSIPVLYNKKAHSSNREGPVQSPQLHDAFTVTLICVLQGISD